MCLNECGGAGGGTVSASAFTVILLLHSKAARHSAEGRRERKREKMSDWVALEQLQLRQSN